VVDLLDGGSNDPVINGRALCRHHHHLLGWGRYLSERFQQACN